MNESGEESEGPEIGCGVSCGEIFVQSFDAALEKAAAISRYRGGRLGSISSHGCSTRRPSPVNIEEGLVYHGLHATPMRVEAN